MASNSTAYPLSRGYKATARLNLQHLIHAKDVGFILHPSIPVTVEGIKVADIGTGTGQLPTSAVLDGFDVSSLPFPPKEWLPPNVNLDVLDIYKEIPQHLHHKYDVVNLRYFCCVVRDNDPSTIIKNVLKLLKPGGHIQWSEQDYTNQSVIVASPQISASPFTAVKEEIEVQSKSSEARFIWLGKLSQILEEHGFTDVNLHRYAENPEYYSIWQQTYMMVAEEMSYSVPGGEKIRQCLAETQAETPEGVFWHRGHVVFVGRKPTTEKATNGT